MPANLTPQYHKAEQAYREAKTPAEKLACLEEMYALLPKHKGTEKMQSDLKQRMSALRHEAGQESARKKAAGELVEKEGAGQVVLLGAPNVGKSQLLAAVTHAKPEIHEYPFTTQRAQPGMMKFEDVQIQLVDLPAVTQDIMPTWIPDMVRRANAALLMVDLSSDDVLDQAQVVLDRLSAIKLILRNGREGKRGHSAFPTAEKQNVGPSELGKRGQSAFRTAEKQNVPFSAEDDRNTYRPAILVANKCDVQGAAERLQIFEDFYAEKLPILVISAAAGTGLHDLRRAVFDMLGVIRVYSKVPGKPADMDEPFVLPMGSTVLDMARTVHKELAEHLVRARIWGKGAYAGQSVSRDHILADGDVVELHE
jgi:hypothetical protein